MSTTIFLSVASIFFILIILVVYFSKERIKTSENKVFSKLLITSFASLFSEIYITFLPNDINNIFFVFALKLLLVLLILWLSYFMEYVFIITRNNEKKSSIDYKNHYKKAYTIFWVFSAIVMLISIFSEIKYFNSNGMKYSYGPSVDIVFGLSGFYTIIMTFYVLKNIKNLKNRGYYPIIFLIFLMLATSIVQKINPSFLIANTSFAIITSLMYFTIENPDVKMLEVYNRNKELVENSLEEKSNLLFKISQDVKEPIKQIGLISKEIAKNTQDKEILNQTKNINDLSKEVAKRINGVLNISDLDIHNIKFFESTYNVYSLFNQIIYLTMNNFDKDIEFKYSISSSIPESLYGDSVKLKQVIYSVIANAMNNTKKGYVDLDISSIIKYNICRLIIKVSDSGKGMNLDKINKILEREEELSPKEIEKLDKLDVDLKNVKKIIDILGGTLFIKSEIGSGSEFTIIIDQKIDNSYDMQASKSIEKISLSFSNKKKVLIIDDDYKSLDILTKELQKNNLEVISTMHEKEFLSRLNERKFDLIFIDDELYENTAVELLKKIENKNLKLIIMLNEEKKSIKEHYLNDYNFVDYLLKNEYVEEIKRIINKNL